MNARVELYASARPPHTGQIRPQRLGSLAVECLHLCLMSMLNHGSENRATLERDVGPDSSIDQDLIEGCLSKPNITGMERSGT